MLTCYQSNKRRSKKNKNIKPMLPPNSYELLPHRMKPPHLTSKSFSPGTNCTLVPISSISRPELPLGGSNNTLWSSLLHVLSQIQTSQYYVLSVLILPSILHGTMQYRPQTYMHKATTIPLLIFSHPSISA